MLYYLIGIQMKKSYLLLQCKKDEKGGKVVSWDAFPLVPLETIIIQQSSFLSASTLFVVPQLTEKMLYFTPSSHHQFCDRPHL
jgi:hypothetical protein